MIVLSGAIWLRSSPWGTRCSRRIRRGPVRNQWSAARSWSCPRRRHWSLHHEQSSSSSPSKKIPLHVAWPDARDYSRNFRDLVNITWFLKRAILESALSNFFFHRSIFCQERTGYAIYSKIVFVFWCTVTCYVISVAEQKLCWAAPVSAPASGGQGPVADSGSVSDLFVSALVPGKKRRL